MEARFFRERFHTNGKGIYHTLAYRDEIENVLVHLSYLSEGGEEPRTVRYPIDILVAADRKDETMEQVVKIMETHPVDRLYLPGTEQQSPLWGLIAAKPREVREFLEGETLTWKEGQWEFWLGNFGGTLSLYHGFAGTKDLGEDCVYTGKIYGPKDHCSPCLVDEKRDFCGFGCFRHRDVHLMKGHLDPRKESFRTGTLLPGSGVFRGAAGRLWEEAARYREKIRVIQLPHTIEQWDPGILALAPEREFQYYVGYPEQEPGIAGEIARHSGYCLYVPADCSHGLCLSGYFIPFQREKNC